LSPCHYQTQKSVKQNTVEKQFELSGTDGIYLLATPNGGKCWRLKYRFNGKEKLFTLGIFSGELMIPAYTAETSRSGKAHFVVLSAL
jgi:hypothetical protein